MLAPAALHGQPQAWFDGVVADAHQLVTEVRHASRDKVDARERLQATSSKTQRSQAHWLCSRSEEMNARIRVPKTTSPLPPKSQELRFCVATNLCIMQHWLVSFRKAAIATALIASRLHSWVRQVAYATLKPCAQEILWLRHGWQPEAAMRVLPHANLEVRGKDKLVH